MENKTTTQKAAATPEVAKIPVGRGRFALVSLEDFEELSKHRWCTTGKGYAMRNKRVGHLKYKYTPMHREVMLAPHGVQVDHINGNILDNRRENLRLATQSENARNTKKRKDGALPFKGVSPWPRGYNKKFKARITCDGKRHLLGYFVTAEEAAEAYRIAAMKMHGEFARVA